MGEGRDRRASDRITAELLELIKKESREPEKGVLLILYQMSELVTTNVSLVREVKKSVSAHNKVFEEHKEESLGYLNKAKGGWKVLLASVALFNILLLSALGYIFGDYKELKKGVAKVQSTQVTHIKTHLYRNRSN